MPAPPCPRTRRRLLAAGASLAFGNLAAQAPRAGAAMLTLELELPPRRYLARERMPLKLTLRNGGDAPALVPRLADTANGQPRFVVEGPSFAAPVEFTPRRGLAADVDAGALARRPDSTETLAPGQASQLALDLSRMADFAKAGRHTLKARIEWEGRVHETNPLAFDVSLGRLVSARLMLDDGFQRRGTLPVLCLFDDGRERALYSAVFRETAPDFSGVEFGSLVRVAAADATADEAMPPWTNYARGDSFILRFGWRGAAAFGIEGLRAGQRSQAAVPAGALRVQPALMAKNGDVDLFQWHDDRVTLWRCGAPQRAGEPPPPQVLWQQPLPAGQQVARAARGPGREGSVVVFAARSPSGVLLTLVESAEGRPQVRQAELRLARLLPQSEMAVRVDAAGRVQAALVVAADNGLRRVYCADVTWPATSGAARVGGGAAASLPQAPVAAAAAFDVAPGGERRDWVALLPDGQLRRGDAGAFEPAGQPPVLPLQLLVLGKHSYLLVQGPGGVPALEALG